MDTKTTVEKLRILLPHWIEHNRNHEAEFRKWATLARADGAENLAKCLDQAADNMSATDALLRKTGIAVPSGVDDQHFHGQHHHDHRAAM